MKEEKYFINKFGKWSQPSVPHKGWKCIDIQDLGEPLEICEMCEKNEIRYVHYMKHQDYPDILAVGCVCAGNMEENTIIAKKRDDFMKSRSNKKKKWLDKKWKLSKKGNLYIESDGFIIILKNNGSYWSANIKNEFKNINIWSKRKYSTKNEVKLAAFDHITKLLFE